jgi:serine/threonine protein kinase
MSYCLNPNCFKPYNPETNKFCQSCGTKLLLKERYRPRKLIGRGGFGKTFLAQDEDKPSQPYCVIKQFCPEGQNNAVKAAELFEQEALRLEQLGIHPQIPDLYAHFTQDDRQYIVQEFIEGQNLAEELQDKGIFSETDIILVLNDLLPLLQFIHQREVIHRDIKPENIIRSLFYQKLVLVDFGAAKYATATSLAKTGTIIGSPEFIAPEQIRGKPTFASDIYSLGVTCLYLLTQVSPFDLFDTSEDTWKWRDYLVNNPVGNRLGIILDKMTQNSLKLRYRNVEEILQDFPDNLAPSNLVIHLLPRPFVQANISIQPVSSSIKWQCLETFTEHTDSVTSVIFSLDGHLVISGSEDTTLKVWHLKLGKKMRTLSGHSGRINCLKISPDGQLLASTSWDTTIKIWNLKNLQEVLSLGGHKKWVISVVFSQDQSKLLSISCDRIIKIWNLTKGRAINCFQLKLYYWFNSVAFSPNNQILASGNWDNTIRLWDLKNKKEIMNFYGHVRPVNSIIFTQNGDFLISGGDKKIKNYKDTKDTKFFILPPY